MEDRLASRAAVAADRIEAAAETFDALREWAGRMVTVHAEVVRLVEGLRGVDENVFGEIVETLDEVDGFLVHTAQLLRKTRPTVAEAVLAA